MNLQITNNSVIYIQKPFDTFNIQLLKVNFKDKFGNFFYHKFSYSFDKQNWSDEYTIDNFPDLNDTFSFRPLNVWIAINIHEINNYSYDTEITKSATVDTLNHRIKLYSEIHSIYYDNKEITINDIKTSIQQKNVINRLPRWNIYDNNQVSVNNWLNQCQAISEMYGHTVIWFHTSPKDTNHTLVNNQLKDVVSIKRIPIVLVGNEIPQDRTVFTEWDMQLEGEFITNVVDRVFKQAFGDEEIPIQKDFMYLPLMNKMYRVSSVQPKNGFMGKIGWWEVFFTKFEDNLLPNQLQLLNDTDIYDVDFLQELENDIVNNSFYDNEYQIKINEESTTVTESYTNKAIDSTHFIDVKESEYFRELIDNRIDIVSVNPQHNLFPVSMYNFDKIQPRVVCMRWLVGKGVNKKNWFEKSFRFICNFVITKKFTGELIDFDNFLSIKINRQNKLIFVDNLSNQEFSVDIKENEFYQLELLYYKNKPEKSKHQIITNIFKLDKGKKIQNGRNIYIVENYVIGDKKINISNMIFYGGKYLMNDLYLYLDDDKLIQDNVNPILNTKTNI